LNVSDYFDNAYGTHERYWWKEETRHASSPDDYPQSLLARKTLRLIAGRPPMRVLDLGAGEGADAIRLALLGHHVDAIEISAVAVGKIRRFADAERARVNVELCNITDYCPSRQYDLIICNGVLHYIEDKASVVQMMQDATAPDGLNVISLWSTESPVPSFHNQVPTFRDDEDGIVVKAYQGWREECLRFERNKKEKSHNDMPEHTHSHIKLIARKQAE
jgi:SAM-dependent methyltransferase